MVVYRDGVAYTHGGIKPVVPCRWCGNSTHMLGTRECDQCWELRSRVQSNPDLARRMLEEE